MNSPIFVHWWCWYDPRCCLQWASTSSGKCEAELISHVNRESTLLSNLATILHSVREGGLTRIRQEKQRAAHAWAAELWRPSLWRCGWWKSSSMQAFDGERSNDPTLGQSLKKVLHADDLWPQVLNPGVWETWDFKIWSQIHSYWSEQKGAWWGLHTVSNSFSQVIFLDLGRLAPRLQLTAAGMKALGWLRTF